MNSRFASHIGTWITAGSLLGTTGFILATAVHGQGSTGTQTINRKTAATDDQGRAIQELTQQVGFEVVAPTLGTAWKLSGAEAMSGEGTLAHSLITFSPVDPVASSSRVQVVQFNLRLIHPANDAVTDVEPPAPGYDLKVDRSSNQAVYTLRSETQTFVITLEGPPVTDADLTRQLIASLAR